MSIESDVPMAGALSLHIGRKLLNLKAESSITANGVVADTFLRSSSVSIHGNTIHFSHARLLTSATTFGSTANGGGISFYAGSSGFTRISSLSVMGSTNVTESGFLVANNSISHSKAIGKILFGRINGADVRGGGMSFFMGFTAVSFVSGNWRLGHVGLRASSIVFTGNVFAKCSALTESDSFAFASSAHGGAVSLFIGTASPFLQLENG
jgi:hypothetical protein